MNGRNDAAVALLNQLDTLRIAVSQEKGLQLWNRWEQRWHDMTAAEVVSVVSLLITGFRTPPEPERGEDA